MDEGTEQRIQVVAICQGAEIGGYIVRLDYWIHGYLLHY